MLYNWSMKITKFWVLIRKVTWKILALCIEIRHLEVEAFEASEASEALSDRHPSDFAYVALIPWSIAQNLTASARYEVTIGTTKKKSDMTGWCEKKKTQEGWKLLNTIAKHMEVSNPWGGTPKSSTFIAWNKPSSYWGTRIVGHRHII